MRGRRRRLPPGGRAALSPRDERRGARRALAFALARAEQSPHPSAHPPPRGLASRAHRPPAAPAPPRLRRIGWRARSRRGARRAATRADATTARPLSSHCQHEGQGTSSPFVEVSWSSEVGRGGCLRRALARATAWPSPSRPFEAPAPRPLPRVVCFGLPLTVYSFSLPQRSGERSACAV